MVELEQVSIDEWFVREIRKASTPNRLMELDALLREIKIDKGHARIREAWAAQWEPYTSSAKLHIPVWYKIRDEQLRCLDCQIAGTST